MQNAEFLESFASLFTINMGVTPGEKIVVFSDLIRDDESIEPQEADRRRRLYQVAEAAAAFAADRYGNAFFVGFPATAGSGVEPPPTLWHAVMGERIMTRLEKEGLLEKLIAKTAGNAELDAAREIVLAGCEAVADVVVALSNNSTSHTRFRALANAAGCRFASLPHFDPDMFFGAMLADWDVLKARTDRLAAALAGAAEIRLATPNGTRMTFGCIGRTAAGDDGILTAPGSFGNLPAGEVYLAPVEGTSSGEMVLEYTPSRKLDSPVRLLVRDGVAVSVEGDDPFTAELREAFAANPLVRNIAELGIGTNDRATRPDNILEAEKILGTVHIALGDNSGFGGKVQVPFHEDYVFFQPTLVAVFPDGREVALLRDGELII
ncbi:thermophilic metalloprotease [Geobacter sp. OR-1]|uniref:aminopeptidase n=1 Tax=Geobacter sp. OR-1 TaxID=1266765 RepID=UPI0005427AC1|nr:aminopeptidase [Geobacter sp. OR-1]GAM08989.1 thermophilic metalloprotease [Geobacter sp. OR-1]